MRTSAFIDALQEGPIDIVGDIHGELDALDTLLEELGYDAAGNHPEHRRLVFIGDLIDRGPNSPGVVERVINLVESERAQCILGNHELILLRGVVKNDNQWFMAPEGDPNSSAGPISERLSGRIRDFLLTLPLALVREDLRIVHACWHAKSISRLHEAGTVGRNILELYEFFAMALESREERSRVIRRKKLEFAKYGHELANSRWNPVLLKAHADVDVDYQMNNPVRVLTSGAEARAAKPYWSRGKWRMVERTKWWDHYDESTPVIIGHYWRRVKNKKDRLAPYISVNIFEDIAPYSWMGKRSNVFCVDYSVGVRALERSQRNAPPYHSKLSALRLPEWTLIHDSGETFSIGCP